MLFDYIVQILTLICGIITLIISGYNLRLYLKPKITIKIYENDKNITFIRVENIGNTNVKNFKLKVSVKNNVLFNIEPIWTNKFAIKTLYPGDSYTDILGFYQKQISDIELPMFQIGTWHKKHYEERIIFLVKN